MADESKKQDKVTQAMIGAAISVSYRDISIMREQVQNGIKHHEQPSHQQNIPEAKMECLALSGRSEGGVLVDERKNRKQN